MAVYSRRSALVSLFLTLLPNRRKKAATGKRSSAITTTMKMMNTWTTMVRQSRSPLVMNALRNWSQLTVHTWMQGKCLMRSSSKLIFNVPPLQSMMMTLNFLMIKTIKIWNGYRTSYKGSTRSAIKNRMSSKITWIRSRSRKENLIRTSLNIKTVSIDPIMTQQKMKFSSINTSKASCKKSVLIRPICKCPLMDHTRILSGEKFTTKSTKFNIINHQMVR